MLTFGFWFSLAQLISLTQVMNLMGPAVISGFQTAAAITIALGQFKAVFGYGKDFSQSNEFHVLIGSFIDLRDTVSTRAVWSGFVWIGIMLVFKYVNMLTRRIKGLRGTAGVRILWFLKITGPVLLCIIAIVSTKLAGLYLSPGCTVFNEKTGVSNVYFANATTAQWNITGAPRDNPGCVPMPKSRVGSILPLPWPRDRALQITGQFGSPPVGNAHLRWCASHHSCIITPLTDLRACVL